MNCRAILLASLAVVAVACGNADTSAPTAVQATPQYASRLLRAGDVHRYAFSWTVAAHGDAAMVGGASVGGDVSLAGELAVRVYKSDADAAVLGVRFARLDEHRVAVMGHNVLPSAELLTADEAILLVPRDGRAHTLQFAPGAPPIFRKLIEGTLAHVDLSVSNAAGSTFDAVGPTGNGLAKLHYEADPNDARRLTRTIVDYVRVDAVPGAPANSPWTVDARGSITRGDDAWPEAIDVSETLSLVGKETPLAFGSDTIFKMHRVGIDHEEPGAVPNVEGWVTRDLFEAPNMDEVEQEMARKFAEGLTVTDVIINVQSAGRGLPPAKGFMIRARGLLRGWPELATELAPLFEDNDDMATRELVLDILVSADTLEAQAVILELLGDPAVLEGGQLPQLLQHLALLRTPTPELAGFLISLHETSRSDADDPLALGVLYTMGSVAAQLQQREPETSERLLVALRGALADATSPAQARAALAGLGNAARDEDLERVLAWQHHEDPNVRAQVASSIRRSTDERSTNALFAYLFDENREVAAASLSVLDVYRPDVGELHRLAAQVINGTVNPRLHGPLVSVLAKRGLDDDLAREALGILHALATDGRDRVRIERILGGSA